MINTNKNIIYLLLVSLFMLGCEDDVGPDGKVNITLDATSAFKSTNPDTETTTVIWGCVVLTEDLTACLYYYNGFLQIDNNMSSEAQNAGPGTTGFTFKTPGETISGLEGGDRTYAFYKATFNNADGSVVGSIDESSGTLDVYANQGTEGQAGDDRNVLITFNSAGIPSVTDQ